MAKTTRMEIEAMRPGAAEWIAGGLGLLIGLVGFVVPIVIAVIVLVQLSRIAANTAHTAAAVDQLVDALRRRETVEH